MSDKDKEAHEKLSSISNGLKVLQDRHAGRVPHVKKLSCKLNFAARPQLRKQQKNFVDLKISRRIVWHSFTVFKLNWDLLHSTPVALEYLISAPTGSKRTNVHV